MSNAVAWFLFVLGVGHIAFGLVKFRIPLSKGKHLISTAKSMTVLMRCLPCRVTLHAITPLRFALLRACL
jgi:hypothetical protein